MDILFDYIFFRIKRALFILFKMFGGGGCTYPHGPWFLCPCVCWFNLKEKLSSLSECRCIQNEDGVCEVTLWTKNYLFSLFCIKNYLVSVTPSSKFAVVDLKVFVYTTDQISRRNGDHCINTKTINHRACSYEPGWPGCHFTEISPSSRLDLT